MNSHQASHTIKTIHKWLITKSINLKEPPSLPLPVARARGGLLDFNWPLMIASNPPLKTKK